jgi:acyl-coenzyme A synthetase/AMP-(fatty) acid ligase
MMQTNRPARMITQLIFDWAKQTPEKPAIIYNGQIYSYRAFAQLIATARAFFARAGYVGRGYGVLAVGHAMSFWIISLALRSLGLTTLAVSGGAAAAEAMRRVLAARCVIISPREIDLLKMFSESIVAKPAESLGSFEAPEPPGAHILLTSGTTGMHKMVLMSSASDGINLHQRANVFGINSDSHFTIFNMAPWTGGGYGWPASTWMMGGAVIIRQDQPLWGALLQPGLTHAVVTPPMLDKLLSAPTGAFPRSESLRLAVGGGTITAAQFEGAKARITSQLFNWLGSTEAGVLAFTPLHGTEDRKWHRLTPGRAIEIVDESDLPVPIGKIGRLRVTTVGGWPNQYHCDEAATRAFFKNDFFYPGDLGLMRADGRVALQGRTTDVINVGGLKIAPAPIEDRLVRLLRVNAVCLISTQNDNGEEEIHVIVETPKPIDSDEVMPILNQELHGLDNARIHYVAALPRNQMGKILRQKIQADVAANQLAN